MTGVCEDASSATFPEVPMLEYVFFDERPFKMFVAFLEARGLKPETRIEAEITTEDDRSFQVGLEDDDLDDDLNGTIEAEYERLLDLNQELFYEEAEAGPANYRMASVVLHLKDGRTSNADVPPEILGKILKAVSIEEFDAFLSAVVAAVEEPDDRSFCRKVRDGDVGFGKR
jgi:hypothetical protein